MGFSENLRYELEYQGMQVKELAEKTGLSINTLNKYRPGSKVVPTVDNAAKIAKVLNISLDYLVTGIESEKPLVNTVDVQAFTRKLRRFSKKDTQLVIELIDSIYEKYV